VLFRSILLPTIVAPTIVASVVLLLSVFGVRERLGGRGQAAAATALAFLYGFVALTGWPRWPPIDATQRLFFLVALAAAAAPWVDSRRRTRAVWVLRGFLTAALLVLLLQTPLEHRWSAAEKVFWLSGLFVLGLGFHAAWARGLRDEGDRSNWMAAFVRIAMLGGVAALIGMSGSARLAQLTGALTCGVGVIEVGSRILRRRPWRTDASLVLATATLGLLLIAYFYAELETLPAALAALALLMTGAPIGRASSTRIVALLPLALALGLAAHALANQPEDPYADDYGGLFQGRPTRARNSCSPCSGSRSGSAAIASASTPFAIACRTYPRASSGRARRV